jgi:hypothetical protein
LLFEQHSCLKPTQEEIDVVANVALDHFAGSKEIRASLPALIDKLDARHTCDGADKVAEMLRGLAKALRRQWDHILTDQAAREGQRQLPTSALDRARLTARALRNYMTATALTSALALERSSRATANEIPPMVVTLRSERDRSQVSQLLDERIDDIFRADDATR